MKKIYLSLGVFFLFSSFLGADELSLIKKFPLKTGELHLSRSVQPQSYFDSVGRKSAILGQEDGGAEIWIYPYKIFHNFCLYFLLEEENRLIDGKTLARRIDVYPHQTILRYVHSSFRVEEIFFTPLRESGAMILLNVETKKPLTVIASFAPDLKPMWPAGLGGQYSYWDEGKKYFILSEGTRKNIALVGSPTSERFSSGPAHALPEEGMKFKIRIGSKKAKRYFFPIFISASHEGRKKADQIYLSLNKDFKRLYFEKFRYYERIGKEFLTIQTPNKVLNQAFEWAKVAVDKALVCNPQLGCGLVAGYGLSGQRERPGFAWFFGGDTFFNSLALNSFGSFDISHHGLTLIRNNQRQDGKIMHELSQGAAFIPWFEEYPYGFYHAETTPYYIVALYDYLNWSSDTEFLKESWASLKKAYRYMLSADTDHDGLMENTAAGLAALELGAFLEKTKSDIYLAALSAEAFRTFSEMATLMEEKKLALDSKRLSEKALNSLQEKFWIKEEKKYAHALTVEDKPLTETTIWPSMPLFFHQLPPDKADMTLDIFSSSEMSTDWGVRSLSPKSNYYDPLNYNYGTVWPFLTGYTCLAEYNYDRTQPAFSHLMHLAHHTFIDALGFCPELFSGEFFIPLEESVPHQIFSSSPIITCTVRGLLGLKGNALKKEIEFRPNLPGSWQKTEIKNFILGKDIFDLEVKKTEGKLILQIKASPSLPYRLCLSPSLGYGCHIKQVRVNGIDKEFRVEKNRGEVRCLLSLELKDQIEVEIEHEDSIFTYVSPHFPRIGDETRGLKIIRVRYKENQMSILVEGLGGEEYSIYLLTSRSILASNGAEFVKEEKGKKEFKLSFEQENKNYFKKEIVIKFKL
jgi:glycogen debranching enzyme